MTRPLLFLYNTGMDYYIFLIPIAVGLTAQIIKTLIGILQGTYRWSLLPSYGGIPSAHTAFVISLTTTIALINGIYSAAFAIAFFLSIIIVDDALRLRVFLGNHGKALNILRQSIYKDNHLEARFPHLETRIGHSFIEVIAGVIVGIVLTLLIFFVLGIPFDGIFIRQ